MAELLFAPYKFDVYDVLQYLIHTYDGISYEYDTELMIYTIKCSPNVEMYVVAYLSGHGEVEEKY